jgi:uncharacterized membrane protein
MSQLAPLVLGLVVFLVGHVVPRFGGIRENLVARWGQGAYRGLHSVLSLLGLGLIIYGYGAYRAQGYIPLWAVPRFFNHIAILLLWPAMILIAAAWLPGTISAKAKHPLLAGVKLWALVHLIINGDLGSLLLFGSFLAMAVVTRIRIGKQGGGERVPGALATPALRNDLAAIIIGTAISAAMIMGLHKYLIGVSIL